MSHYICANCKKLHGNAHMPWFYSFCPRCKKPPTLLEPLHIDVNVKFFKENNHEVICHGLSLLEKRYGGGIAKFTQEQVDQFVGDLWKLGVAGSKNWSSIKTSARFQVTRDHELHCYLRPQPRLFTVPTSDTSPVIGPCTKKLVEHAKKIMSGSQDGAAPPPCKCNIMAGCTCGRFEWEQTQQNK